MTRRGRKKVAETALVSKAHEAALETAERMLRDERKKLSDQLFVDVDEISPGFSSLPVAYQAYVLSYIGPSNGHGTKAAIDAGYSSRSAHVQSSLLLKNPKITDAIAAILKRRARNGIMTQDELEAFLTRIIRKPMKEYLESGADGVRYIDIGHETIDTDLLQKVISKTSEDGVVSTTVEQADKLTAGALLAKMRGWVGGEPKGSSYYTQIIANGVVIETNVNMGSK